MCGLTCVKRLLFGFNVIFWLAGVILLAFGLWMKLDSDVINYISMANFSSADPLIGRAATLFIFGGALIFIIGFLGCCGALKGHQAALFVYALLLLLIMGMELAAAVVVVIYKGKVESAMKSEMYMEIQEKYLPGREIQSAWDHFQVQMRCCGVLKYTDYKGSAWYNETKNNGSSDEVPVSCCTTDKSFLVKNVSACQQTARSESTMSRDYLNQDGCYDSLLAWFKRHTLGMVVVAFVVGFIEVFGFVTACLLRVALKRTAKEAQ